MSIQENYDRIRQRIAGACARAGRSEEEITLLAVTKYVEIARIKEAIDCGIREVGENRAQEFTEKLEFYKNMNVSKHFIGQLQTNKVKYIVGKADLLQSVDRLPLLEEVARVAEKKDVVQPILIEVNIAGEMQKGGIMPEDLFALLDRASACEHIRVKGLMCIPPMATDDEVRPYFASMRKLFERVSALSLPNVDMQVLSMGMSGDFEVAIEEGASIVRVGTGLFGGRVYT